MGPEDQLDRAHEWRAKAAVVFDEAVENVKKAVGRADVWVQDHLGLAVLAAVVAGAGAIGGLVAWQGTQVFVLAKLAAPFFTITSVIVGGGIATFRWFRKRRDARKNEPPAVAKPKEPVAVPASRPSAKANITISTAPAAGASNTTVPPDEPKSDESS